MWKTIGIIAILIVLSIYDIRSRELPVRILAGVGCLGVLYAVGCIMDKSYSIAEYSVALLPGILFLLGGKLTSKIGYGDGLLLLVLGLLLEVREVISVFFLSLILTGIISGILLCCGKVRQNTHIPYVPFLTLAMIAAKI